MLRFSICLLAAAALVGCNSNRPPTTPELSGPTSARPLDTLTFTVTSADPDGDEVAYKFIWGDTSSVAWSAEYLSGQAVTRQHWYADTGDYVIRVRARDAHGLEAGDYDSLVVQVRLAPPGTPGRPEGPAYCTTGVRYTFKATGSHPQAESLWFQFDWNGEVGNWLGPVAPESSLFEEHVFDTAGTYSLKVRAKDDLELMSDWSEALVVTVVAIPGGPPQNLAIEAASDTTVRLSWQEPVEGPPNAYQVLFKPSGGGGYALVTETEPTVLTYEHNPSGGTGWYELAARYGATVYEDTLPVTTAPVHTGTITIGEVNGPDNPGGGWDRFTGLCRSSPMNDSLYADSVDLYVTDFAQGSAGPVYYLASPDTAVLDSSARVPAGRWRRTKLTQPLADEQLPLPAAGDTGWVQPVGVTPVPATIGCLTQDGYFALIKVTQVRIANEDLRAQAWFQLVRGLRLIQH